MGEKERTGSRKVDDDDASFSPLPPVYSYGPPLFSPKQITTIPGRGVYRRTRFRSTTTTKTISMLYINLINVRRDREISNEHRLSPTPKTRRKKKQIKSVYSRREKGR